MKPIDIPQVSNYFSAIMFIAIGISVLCQPFFGSATQFMLLHAVMWTAIIAVYLLRFIHPEWRPRNTKPFSVYLLLLVLMVAPSALAGIHPLESSLYAALVVLFYFAFLAVREAFSSSPRGFLSSKMFAILSACGAVLLVLGHLAFRAVHSSTSLLPWFSLATEIPEHGKNLDHLSDFILIAVFPLIAAAGAAEASAGRRMLWRAAAAVAAAGILLSFSRSAWIAFALELVVLAVLDRSQRRLLLAGMATACVLIFLLPGVTERLASIFTMAQGTNMQRIEQWAGSFELIRGSPFTGYGIGSFGELYQKLGEAGTAHILPCPHNLFLHLAVECGLPALFIFLAVAVHFLRRMLRTEETPTTPDDNGFSRAFRLGVFASVIGMLCFGLFDL